MKDLIKIDPSVHSILSEYKLPEHYSFGSEAAPLMITGKFKDSTWSSFCLNAFQNISINPNSKVLHYGQAVFEGMKLYKSPTGQPQLFRPLENYKRFVRSSERIGLPIIPEKIFMESLKTLSFYLQDFIPTKRGHSIYLRPFLFADEPTLGLNLSKSATFMITASPVSSFGREGYKVLIEREFIRAAPGGTGSVKFAGNYAASLASTIKVKQLDLDQSLWLDAINHSNIEELSGMNFFAVYNQELHTPKLTDTILPGVTRDSLILLAKDLGLEVKEKSMPIEQLINDIKNGECTECFACGTASIVTPIVSLHEENGETFTLEPNNPITTLLKNSLLDIQEGKTKDLFEWTFPIKL